MLCEEMFSAGKFVDTQGRGGGRGNGRDSGVISATGRQSPPALFKQMGRFLTKQSKGGPGFVLYLRCGERWFISDKW